MFQHLEPGRPHRKSAANPSALIVSGVLHAVALAAAVHLTGPTADSLVESTMEEVTMMSVMTAFSAPAVDAGAALGEAMEALADASATSTEIVSSEVPVEIPPVEATLALDGLLPNPPGMWSGGSSPGSGSTLVLDSVIVMALQSPFRFDYDGLESIEPPSIRNREAMSELLADMYPRRLRFAGISGMVTLRFAIDERGRVEPASVRLMAADREEFAMVALRVVGRFRFSPARYRGEPVSMVIELPINWVSARY